MKMVIFHLYQTVREHYLRDDIYCGSKTCMKCKARPRDMVLDMEDAKSSLIPSPYFLVLDTNIILDQVSSYIKYIIIWHIILYEFSTRLSDLISNYR